MPEVAVITVSGGSLVAEGALLVVVDVQLDRVPPLARAEVGQVAGVDAVVLGQVGIYE